MDRHHPVVLEQGVRSRTLGGRVRYRGEGVGHEEQDPEKEELHSKERAEYGRGHPDVPEPTGGEQGIKGLKGGPEQDRPLKGRPQGSELDPGGAFGGVVLGGVDDREVVGQKRPLEGGEGEEGREEGDHRRPLRRLDVTGVPGPPGQDGKQKARPCKHKAQDQCEVARDARTHFASRMRLRTSSGV